MDPNHLADTLSAPPERAEPRLPHSITLWIGRPRSSVDCSLQRRAAALHVPDSKKAQTLQAYVTMRQQSLTDTQTTSSQAQAPVPIANPQEFIIYGYVYGRSGAPAANIIVSAADEKGNIFQTTNSDATGSYALHIAAASSQTTGTGYRSVRHESILHEVIEKIEECVEGEDGSERPPGTTAPPPPVTLHLVATDQKKTFQIQSPTMFQFEAGKLAYQDLNVPA